MAISPHRHHRCAGIVLCVTLTLAFDAGGVRAQERGSGYLAYQRWLFAADVAANDAVTYEICGWGMIDLRTPFLASAIKQDVDVTAWHELAKRYDDAMRERRQTEAMLTAHGANAPTQRISGLYATGGCTEPLRKRIEQQSVDDQAMRVLPASP